MDGIIGDFFRLGRRVRTATPEYALSNFPKIILRMKQMKLEVSYEVSACHNEVVRCWNKNIFLKSENWVITKKDFELCVSILEKARPIMFNESENSYELYAKGLVSSMINDKR